MFRTGERIDRFSERQMLAVRGDRISMIFQEPMSSLNPVYKVGTQIAEVIRPLIAPERFGAGFEPREVSPSSSPVNPGWQRPRSPTAVPRSRHLLPARFPAAGERTRRPGSRRSGTLLST